MDEIQLQIYPNNNINEHVQVQGESSSRSRSRSSPPKMGSSSSLFSSQPDSSPNQPTTTLTMNALHYSLLFKEEFSDLRDQVEDNVSSVSNKCDSSSLLHLAASVGQLSFIDRIRQLSDHSTLLNKVNSKGDLPVHVAARACQLDAVKGLVWHADDVLGWTNRILEAWNEDQNTALHIALENHQQEMATFLFQKCQNTFYYLNNQGFSPLYLAIKAQFWDLVTRMLSTNDAQAESRLLQGKSVVHAVIIANKPDIFKMMLRNYRELYKTTDEMGRTPLSYASYVGFLEGVKYMINTDEFQNQAYKIDEHGFFPVHWACCGGNMDVVKEFFCSYPKYTRWLLNRKGQNILHVAAGSGKAKVVQFILERQELETMINMKDEDGNTPFLLGSKGKHPKVVYLFTWGQRSN